MKQERIVVLVPTDEDMENEACLTKYWPNFVEAVRGALRREGLKCRIVVAKSWPAAAPPERDK